MTLHSTLSHSTAGNNLASPMVNGSQAQKAPGVIGVKKCSAMMDFLLVLNLDRKGIRDLVTTLPATICLSDAQMVRMCGPKLMVANGEVGMVCRSAEMAPRSVA